MLVQMWSRLHETGWFLAVGVLLVAMAILAPRFKQLPITAPAIYLLFGAVLGPVGLDVVEIDVLHETTWIKVIIEIAMLLALFGAGTRMPVPFSLRQWWPAIRIGWLGMAVSIGLMAAFGTLVLGLPLGVAVLLGAILAPTDPVLATEVQVHDPSDRDRLRFTLTAEAGINDGAAMPFAVLGLGLMGLHELGAARWLLVDLVYATAGGIALGVVLGWLAARLATRRRAGREPPRIFEDMLSVGLIGATYGAALVLGVGGFLAVFFAGVAFRCTEHGTGGVDSAAAAIADESLEFDERLGRVVEALLVLAVGAALTRDLPSAATIGCAAFLFFIARPVSVLVCLAGAKVPWRGQLLAGWLGLRGMGSLFYAAYAVEQGVGAEIGADLWRFTLVAVALSVVIHGVSSTPLMQGHERRVAQASRGSASR
jgi:NhaP-type Na+/H+ or K+/H+ antiporter